MSSKKRPAEASQGDALPVAGFGITVTAPSMATTKKPTTKRKPAPSKGGRPRADDPRKNLSLRLTGEERRVLAEKAGALGLPQTIYARNALRRMLGLDSLEEAV